MSQETLRMRLLTSEDISALLALRADVLAGVDDPDLYSREPDEAEFVRTHVGGSGQGETLGIFDSEQLIAYGMLGLPDPQDPEHLGHFLGEDEASLARTAILASCMVNGQYRGRKFQRWLLRERIALARAQGRDICIAMASLRNHASRHNLMSEGLRIGWVGELSGLKRHLFRVNLSNPGIVDEQTRQLIEVSDWERQQVFVQKGYLGVDSLQDDQQRIKLVFARMKGNNATYADREELSFCTPIMRPAEVTSERPRRPADDRQVTSTPSPHHARC
ncbi:hypothetical protein [Ottowia thiooxydans]|uniref:GNAT superfamily N-acetyltransferase n=1 Tax=Ottowia thiooxydans TaxID=219182 RepID=A0ABV2QH19_9BURK